MVFEVTGFCWVWFRCRPLTGLLLNLQSRLCRSLFSAQSVLTLFSAGIDEQSDRWIGHLWLISGGERLRLIVLKKGLDPKPFPSLQNTACPAELLQLFVAIFKANCSPPSLDIISTETDYSSNWTWDVCLQFVRVAWSLSKFELV